jgi:hypothetical protein
MQPTENGSADNVVNTEGLWYVPGATDLVAGALETGANVLTPLRDDVDPVTGCLIARCLLCRIRKTNQPGDARAAYRPPPKLSITHNSDCSDLGANFDVSQSRESKGPRLAAEATVRHCTVRIKGAQSTTTAKLMVFKLVTAEAKTLG